MIIKLGTGVSPTSTSNAAIFQPCKQQQIASGNKLLLVILDSKLLIVLLMTIRLGTQLSPTISYDATTLHVFTNTD